MLRRHPHVTWVMATAVFILVAGSDAALRVDPVYEPRPGTLLPGGTENVVHAAKTEASGHWNDRVPTFAVDGKADTPGDHWGIEGLPAKLALDLGRRQPLNIIGLWPYWGDGRYYQYLKLGQFTFEEAQESQTTAKRIRTAKACIAGLAREVFRTSTALPRRKDGQW